MKITQREWSRLMLDGVRARQIGKGRVPPPGLNPLQCDAWLLGFDDEDRKIAAKRKVAA